MTPAPTRKEPETTGKSARSGPRNRPENPPKGVPVLSGQDPANRSPAKEAKSLTFEQSEALRRFSKDAERSEASIHHEKALDARRSFASAKAALPPREGAIVDLIILRGRSLAALAAASGQTVEQLDQLLRQAANSLADHYQSRDAA